MLLGVILRGFFGMLRCKQMVSVREMSVMPRHFVGTCLMMPCRFPMMPGRVLVMFGRFEVMLRTLVFGHFC